MGMDETCLVLDRDAPDPLSLWIFGILFADAGGLPTRGRSGGGADVEHSSSPHSPLRMFPALTKSCAARCRRLSLSSPDMALEGGLRSAGRGGREVVTRSRSDCLRLKQLKHIFDKRGHNENNGP